MVNNEKEIIYVSGNPEQSNQKTFMNKWITHLAE